MNSSWNGRYTTNGAPAPGPGPAPGASGQRLSPAATQAMVVALAVASVVVIVAFIAWLIWKVRRGNLQTVRVLSSTWDVNGRDSPMLMSRLSNVPPTSNGQEFSYSFWLYLQSIEPSTKHKLLFARSTDVVDVPMAGKYARANPVVFLDGSTNRLYITVPTTNMLLTDPSDLSTFTTPSDKSAYLTSVVDYVPLQRWVHVAFVVQDNMLTTYVDGDVYSVYSIADPKPGTSTTRPIFAGTAGVFQLGGEDKPRAYLGNLQFFNYAVAQRDMAGVYASGPAPGRWLRLLGLPNYGLRTPWYRMD